MSLHLPHLTTGHRQIDRAFRIALGDIASNIVPGRVGLLNTETPLLLAGLGYDTPWVRDTAITAWNGAGLLCPAEIRANLLAALRRDGDRVLVTPESQHGQYWDIVIWTLGAWWDFLFTGDRDFLALALEVTRHTLAYFERTEFDAALNLFRGPAVYGDGVSAYPDIYAETSAEGGSESGGECNILAWTRHHPTQVARPGYGLPMFTLSTNCLYHHVYVLALRMARELRLSPDPAWARRAAAIKASLNRYFWQPEAGTYLYLRDPFGHCDHQEGLGHCLALLFGVADDRQAESIFLHQRITPAGIPCLWPTFDRYQQVERGAFGRHSGTVWPHIQALWAHAAALHRRIDLFAFELFKLAEHACRDNHFTELYHPFTGQPYGGLQEGGSGPDRNRWRSEPRQTWSATGFVRMILMGLLGLGFAPDGVRFSPLVPGDVGHIQLSGLPYRDMLLDITVEGSGTQIAAFRLNGQPGGSPFLSATGSGPQRIEITMTDE
ncbi:MAG: hypothetical protein JXQ72_05275 [Anaerolineae bacterium]|nr:hypothetical protein [Anaerolineae bacterium]